ncbi:unnamed protein product [Ambrosiozyma monospora]|uniref:Unnamed protein product n=1 Tax=Ambrosiozyma monospora TaxID=43982 RepID=A0ACB5T6U5_AMBMO|nr:unnamed protein product [Ambrosiozyma monospora]
MRVRIQKLGDRCSSTYIPRENLNTIAQYVSEPSLAEERDLTAKSMLHGLIYEIHTTEEIIELDNVPGLKVTFEKILTELHEWYTKEMAPQFLPDDDHFITISVDPTVGIYAIRWSRQVQRQDGNFSKRDVQYVVEEPSS